MNTNGTKSYESMLMKMCVNSTHDHFYMPFGEVATCSIMCDMDNMLCECTGTDIPEHRSLQTEQQRNAHR